MKELATEDADTQVQPAELTDSQRECANQILRAVLVMCDGHDPIAIMMGLTAATAHISNHFELNADETIQCLKNAFDRPPVTRRTGTN